MAEIILVATLKGGESKSTTACGLAASLATMQKSVLLIDADEQETSYEFAQIRKEEDVALFDCQKCVGTEVRDVILKLKQRYKYIIIDVGGRHTQSLRAALSVANLLLIPVSPSSESLWSLTRQLNNSQPKFMDIVSEMKGVNPQLKVCAFVSQADSRGKDNEEVMKALQLIPGIEILPTVVKRRIAFRNAMACGLSVSELKGKLKDPKAIDELNKLVSNVKNKL